MERRPREVGPAEGGARGKVVVSAGRHSSAPVLGPGSCLSQGVNCPRAEQQGRSPQPAQIQQHPCREQQHRAAKGCRERRDARCSNLQPVEGKRERLAGTGAASPSPRSTRGPVRLVTFKRRTRWPAGARARGSRAQRWGAGSKGSRSSRHSSTRAASSTRLAGAPPGPSAAPDDGTRIVPRRR